MSLLTALAAPPSRSAAPASYVVNMDAWLASLPTMVAEINALNAADFFPVQSSITDATTGKVMLTGAGGLLADLAPTISDFTASLRPGFWKIYENLVTGHPVGGNYGGVAIVNRDDSSRTHILTMRSSLTQQYLWHGYRATETGAVQWQQLYAQRNVIGTVSQAAGVPTGALIEKGSNANGYYRRFACGKLECWHTKAASSGGAATWTFPSAFIEAPVVGATAVATVSASAQLDAAPGTTAATYSVRDKTDARRADTVHLHAIGRWSALT